MSVVMEARIDFDCQSPLLLNEIAERVLQFVPVAELKACRLVCRLWWKESLARWRRTHWLQLTTYDLDTGRKEDDDSDPDEIRIQKCLDIGVYISLLDDPLDPYKLRTHPFLKLKLFKSQLALKPQENDKLEKFLSSLNLASPGEEGGHSVKFLELKKCTIPTAEDFRRAVFRFAPKLEYLSLSCNVYQKAKRPRKNWLKDLNLKTLVSKPGDVQSHLKYLKLRKGQYLRIPGDSLPLNWTQFFAHFPNVQNLEFGTLNDQYNKPEIDRILDSIKALRAQCGILQQIRGLDVLNLEHIAAGSSYVHLSTHLWDYTLPLTFFAHDVGFGCETYVEWQLKIAATTLETLVIYKLPLVTPTGSFPYENKLPNLTKLTLIGPLVSDLRFLEQMPKLKYVRLFHEIIDEPDTTAILTTKMMKRLHEVGKENVFPEEETVAAVPVVGNTDFSQMSHLSFPNIEEFLVGEENCSAENVKELARLMPNVKRLRIGLNNGSFRAVCRYWKGLEALDIVPARVNEKGITGIVPGVDTRLPNITDLKYLKILGMSDGERKTGFSDLTNSSLENGLLLLKYLERVVVWCSLDKMSNENYQKFKSMFPAYPYCAINRNQTGI